MFSIKFIKFQPTTYVLQYKNGKVRREGAGLAFFYYAPTTSMLAIPMASEDTSFIFEENSSDFQTVTVQGQVTYRISDPQKIGGLLNFAINPVTQQYISDDPKKLSQRIVNLVKVLTRKGLQNLALRDALKAADMLGAAVTTAVRNSKELQDLGVELLGLNFLALKPTPEAAKALEAQAREQILKCADEAIYERRNSAVEQERRIRENELNTEIAVESKKRQIRETQMEAEKSIQHKENELKLAQMQAKIQQENQNTVLVQLATENARSEADSRAYAAQTLMKAYDGVEPKVLQALSMGNMESGQLIALAFQELAEKAGSIGQLNITPDLLREIMQRPVDKPARAR
ncbi:SPFH domain-containing protein [Undibacterium sp. TS12]|uniref:SPFH domain-containing protein n=1 Tax=Undibacterium sp. TS12 TaxID=2908202 RepID=UPI001F4D0B8C|nr:SPFH domain-containing protein [Undibacterium sp. TS12]MCH8620377.1 SPFH domain-containing protein [Undibacterium sp. TS12]